MRKEYAELLSAQAKDIAKIFSNPNRAKNLNKESFAVKEIRPLSDETAAVTFIKNTGKESVMFFYYSYGANKFFNFFPTDSHILGMQSFAQIKRALEAKNFRHNFQSAPAPVSSEAPQTFTQPRQPMEGMEEYVY